MHDVLPFGLDILLVAVAALVAVLGSRVARRLHIPAPAIFLVGAAVVSDIWPQLERIPTVVDQRIVTVALILILFDGGSHIGLRKFRRSAGVVLYLGVVGTVVTTAVLALLIHGLFDFSWRTALLLGTALAPTDPAVVFSVLGEREIEGRAGTVLEGESGANDPVGIAIMAAILGSSGAAGHAFWHGLGEFAVQMAVGAGVGVLGGLALLKLRRGSRLPSPALHLIRALAGALAVYGLATVLHGSGFLAVLLAGVIIGDAEGRHKAEFEQFTGALASLAEITTFSVLGLTVALRQLPDHSDLWIGAAIAGLLILVVRPVFVGALLVPVRMPRAEKLFVLWSGLKGAVPILLGTFVLTAGEPDADRIYRIIFVAVLISVVVQGGLVPTVARRLGLRLRVPGAHPPEAGPAPT